MLQGELKGNLTNNVELKGELKIGNKTPKLIEGNFNSNGEYLPINADGFSKAIVNVLHTIVSAAAPFGLYGDSSSQYIYIDTYLAKGDTIIFAFACRSNITLPTGVELIFKSNVISDGTSQYLMFAKYTATQNEAHYFEFKQSTSNNRFYCTYAIFHDVTVVHSGNFLTYYNTFSSSRTSYEVPDKQENKILFWGFTVGVGPANNEPISVLTTTPDDIFRISWPAAKENHYARLVTFLDNGEGATHRIFTNIMDPIQCHERCIIDAIEIIPN